MIVLTEQQQQALQGDGTRVLDPATQIEYVLVRADLYIRVLAILEEAEDEAEQEAWVDAVEAARADMCSSSTNEERD